MAVYTLTLSLFFSQIVSNLYKIITVFNFVPTGSWEWWENPLIHVVLFVMQRMITSATKLALFGNPSACIRWNGLFGRPSGLASAVEPCFDAVCACISWYLGLLYLLQSQFKTQLVRGKSTFTFWKTLNFQKFSLTSDLLAIALK